MGEIALSKDEWLCQGQLSLGELTLLASYAGVEVDCFITMAPGIEGPVPPGT
jgi:hypothetical protein